MQQLPKTILEEFQSRIPKGRVGYMQDSASEAEASAKPIGERVAENIEYAKEKSAEYYNKGVEFATPYIDSAKDNINKGSNKNRTERH